MVIAEDARQRDLAFQRVGIDITDAALVAAAIVVDFDTDNAMIEQMRAVYFSTPETDKDADPATWSPEDYRDAQRRAVKAVREWLLVNAVLFWTNSQVHPRTLAFLQTLASLARIDLDNKVSLILWRKGDVDGPETVVLTHDPARA